MGSPGGSIAFSQQEEPSVTVIPDEPSFDQLIEPHRTELFAHCYRMLGSVHDAEDVVQEAYLRAWRAREQYDASRSSVRTWMYRIATNACLTALSSGSHRPLPSGFVAESDPLRPLVRGQEVVWLQPLPDALLDAGDPARSAVARDSLRLAFVAALQHLSARQRAVLILRDVLEFSAAETAEILEATVIAVNGLLRRARATVEASGADPDRLNWPREGEQRAQIDRYMRAFLEADIEGLKQLLAEDVLMEMPPMLNWFAGVDNYGLFMEWVFGAAGTDWRLESVSANGQPGFAAYRRIGETYTRHTIQLFDVGPNGITRNSVFQDDDVFTSFGLPSELEP
jgi:RNA polymerase sigma-70 factor, ECF subfamily